MKNLLWYIFGLGLVAAPAWHSTPGTMTRHWILACRDCSMLMYDRQTESLWSQIPGKAVTGYLAGISLARLPVVHLTWAKWRRQYPDSLVLTDDTGFNRDYDGCYPFTDIYEAGQ